MAARDSLFCPHTGSLLQFDAARGVARCPLSGWEKSLAEMSGEKVVSRTDIHEYRRRFNLDPLVKQVSREEEVLQQQGRTRATVDDECPKCKHPFMEYYTRQLRSADEGQTIFYECPNCRFKYQQNS
ncbi:hypothetical protein WJX81_002300 [Elliptochloris bilobata]|uniref:DNA-directed RNA polymerase subunit n=1 Tax=Elliptochloris bilobata TaxID=381761 RepID=A0AAW1RMX2_9CHLO